MNYKGILLACSALALAGCGGGGGGGSDAAAPSANTGTASFDVTDAPVDGVTEVNVFFNALELKPSNGDAITFEFDPAEKNFNLLALQNGVTGDLLEPTVLPAGEYERIRLFVVPGDGSDAASNVMEEGGGLESLFIPGQQNGNNNGNPRFLQLNGPFVVPAGGNVNFIIDFVLRKALVQPPGQNGSYLLRPSLRLINNVETGTIAGNVAAGLRMANQESCLDEASPAVYLYEENDAPVGDIFVDENGVDQHDGVAEVSPLVTAEVDENGNYSIAFVAAGNYTVAYTCQAALDDVPPVDVNDPDSVDDDIVFERSTNVTVTAGATETVNFDVVAPAP